MQGKGLHLFASWNNSDTFQRKRNEGSPPTDQMTKVASDRPAKATKGRKYGGRTAGTPNRATKEFRDTVTMLLSDNAPNVAVWLSDVANGVAADPSTGRKPVPPDPGRALDLITRLAEFAAPKLARTEMTGADGGAIRTEETTRPKLTKAEWLAAHGVRLVDGE